MEGRQGRRQGNLRSLWLGSLQPFVPFPTPLPLAPSLILSCLPLPRKSPPLPGEAPLPPPPQAEALEGALAGIWNVWKTLADFSLRETPSLPHLLGPLRFLSGLTERRPELGKG